MNQNRKRPIFQRYLKLFASVVFIYFLILFVITVLGNIKHQKQGTIENIRPLFEVFTVNMVLLFTTCITGVVKGMDSRPDYYRLALTSGTRCEAKDEAKSGSTVDIDQHNEIHGSPSGYLCCPGTYITLSLSLSLSYTL